MHACVHKSVNEQMKAGEGEPERVTFCKLFSIALPAAENK